MLRLVIFDFDGVIADSERAHYEMFCEVLKTMNIKLTWDEYNEKYLGYTDFDCLYNLLQDKGIPPEAETISRLFEEKKVLFAQKIKESDFIISGVEPFLEKLKHAGIYCAICSGALKSEIEAILDSRGLGEYFPVIVAADDVENGKPDPEGYLISHDRMNRYLAETPACESGNHQPFKPGEILVIEDSPWGILAAKNAGFCCLAVMTSYDGSALNQADRIVEKLSDISVAELDCILK